MILAGVLLLLPGSPQAAPGGPPPPPNPVISLPDAAAVLMLSGLLALLLSLGHRAVRTGLILLPHVLAAALILNRTGANATDILGAFGGERYIWLDDDMMISMRYAMNFARGHGPVWNPGGDPVEGYSNFLWMVWMTAGHAAGLPPRLASGFVIATNMVLVSAILELARRLALRCGVSSSGAVVVTLCLASNRNIVYWAVGGSESVLLAAALTAASLVLSRATRGRPAGAAAGLLLGLIPLIRADAIVLTAALAPAVVFMFLRGRTRPSFPILILLPLLLHLIFRRAFHGEWLPNTYRLKMDGGPLATTFGMHYLFTLVGGAGGLGGVVALFVLFPFITRTRRVLRLISMAVPVQLVWIVYAGGDELAEFRFAVPVVPLLFIGAVRVIESALRRVGRRSDAGPPQSAVLLTLLLAAGPSFCTPQAAAALGIRRGEIERRNVEVGLLIRNNTSPDAVVGHFWAGAAAYFSERTGVDFLGKNDRHVARTRSRPGLFVPGHTKFDLDHSLGLQPDVIVLPYPAAWLHPEVRRNDPDRRTYACLHAIYDHDEFKRLYEENIVPLPESMDFHTIHVRSGSALARPPSAWDYAARP